MKLTFNEIDGFVKAAHFLTEEFEFVSAAVAQSEREKAKRLYSAIAHVQAMADRLSKVEVTVTA